MNNEIPYNRIKEVLNSKGIKQSWLAKQIGKTQRTVNLYVTNVQQPSIPVLFQIARLIGVGVKDLLNDNVSVNQEIKRTKLVNEHLES